MLEKIFVNEMKKICSPTAKAVVKVGQQIWRYKSEHEVPDYIEFDGVQASIYTFFKGGHKNDRYVAQKAIHNYMKYSLGMKERKSFRHDIENEVRLMMKPFDHNHHLSEEEVDYNYNKIVDYLIRKLS